jgi:hypothetical protein
MALKYLTPEELEKWKASNPGKSYFDPSGNQVNVPSTTKDLGFIGNLARTVSKPFRMGGGVAQEFGYTLADLIRMAQGKSQLERPEGYFGLTQEESQSLYNDPLKEGLKSAAGVMSYAVPVGAAKGVSGLKAVGQAGLKGAGAGALGGFGLSESGEELKGTLSGGVTGGLFAGALQGIGEVSKGIKAAKISNKLDDMADELQASALKKDIGIAPTTKQGKNILPKQISEKASSMGVKIKSPEDLKSFGQALYESNANVANQAAQQLDDLGRVIDITEIKRPLLEQLAKTKSPELQAPIQKVIDSIDNATGGSNAISASDLLNLRREWGKLGNWNPFMDPAATTTAGAFEAAYMRANDLLDDAFKGAGITGFKDANKAISLSIDADNWAERAIANKSNRPLWNDMTQDAAIAATVFGGGGPGAVAGAVGSKVAQRYAEPIAEKALRGVSKVTSGLGALPQVLQPLITAGQRAVPAIPGLTGGQAQPTMQPTGVTQAPQQGGASALNLMLAQEVLNGNISATEANAVLSLLGMQIGGGELSANQSKAVALQQSLDTLRGAWEGSGGGTRLAETLGINIGSKTRSLDQAKAAVAEDLGRLQSQGAINAEERKAFDSMMPNSWDSPTVVEQKFMAIQNRINSYR